MTYHLLFGNIDTVKERRSDMSNLTEVYEEILRVNGLKQVQAAEMLGYSKTTIGKFLNVGVTLGNIYELAKALGYEVEIVKRNGKGKITEEYRLER